MKISRRVVSCLQAVSACYFSGLLLIAFQLYEFDPRTTHRVPVRDNVTANAPALNITKAPWLSAPTMPRALTRDQHDLYVQLLEELTVMFYSANITFLVCDGSLLGSYVMHDMLPWDDDVDLMVRYLDLPKVKRLFQDTTLWQTYQLRGYHGSGSEYDLNVLQNIQESSGDDAFYESDDDDLYNSSHKPFHKFKFFYKDTTQAGNRTWNWPFIDVKYYMENDSHVWNLDEMSRTRYIERSEFYPLHLRPFARLWLPAPKNTRAFLISQYRNFVCRRSKWNHKTETRQMSRKVRCWKLSHWYPFVWREDLPGGTLEVLQLDDSVIQYVGVPETYSVFQRPFAL